MQPPNRWQQVVLKVIKEGIRVIRSRAKSEAQELIMLILEIQSPLILSASGKHRFFKNKTDTKFEINRHLYIESKRSTIRNCKESLLANSLPNMPTLPKISCEFSGTSNVFTLTKLVVRNSIKANYFLHLYSGIAENWKGQLETTEETGRNISWQETKHV